MKIVVRCPNCGAAIHPITKSTPSGGQVQYCPVCGAELD